LSAGDCHPTGAVRDHRPWSSELGRMTMSLGVPTGSGPVAIPRIRTKGRTMDGECVIASTGPAGGGAAVTR
jgi:hypothetical protein